jgi:osmotically-inducible protein OsmY
LSDDAILSAKVRGALVREQAFGEGFTLYNLPITLQTTNQIVYFYGVLPNYMTILRVVNVTYAVPGVRGVVSWLRVPFERVYMGT